MIEIKILFKAIVESQQLRRENEEVGPGMELNYWQLMASKFSSIMKHIESSNVQAFIDLLTRVEWNILKVRKE